MSVNHWLNSLRFQFSPIGRRLSRKRRIARSEAAQISSEALENRLLLTTTYINAGGQDLVGTPSFVEDDAFQNGVGRSYNRGGAIDTSQVDSSIPEEVFTSFLWDPSRGPELQFDIPANAGSEYKVDLLFSEIWRGGFDVGRRVFDVFLEGDTVLDNFDIYEEVGARTALVKSFDITATDNNIDIDFGHVRNNPAIAGIIVTEMTDDGGGSTNTPPGISSIPNQTTNQNQPLGPLSFTVNDADGDVVSLSATSSNPAVVAQNAVTTTGTGTNRSVTVTPTQNASGVTTVTLIASDGTASTTEQFVVTVNESDGPVDPPASGAQMLNAGAGAVGEFEAASPFHDNARSSNPRRGASISNVPAGIPEAVFQSNTWSPGRLGDLEFDIPNESGVEYQVDLLFAETWRGAFRNGRRLFDVSIDGQQVLNDFDVFARAGVKTALVETFTVTGDGNLDIDLSHVKNNPMISGIVVTRLGDPPPAENRPPVFNAISNRNINTNTLLEFTASAMDPDGDNLTYSILTQELPGSPTIDSQLGVFSWTPTNAGVFNVTLQASDSQLTDTETFIVTVTDVAANQPPVLAAIPAQQISVGSQLSFTASATDPDAGPGDSITYFLDPSAPTGASINVSSGLVTWTPTANQVGTTTFPVIASDGVNNVFQNVSVVVSAAANSAPVLGPIGNKSVEAGELLTFTATATDADDPGSALQFSLGPGAPAGATINASTGAFQWTPDPFQSGIVSITIEVSDGEAVDAETIQVDVVIGQAPTITAIADQSVQAGTLLQLALTATDPNPNDTLTWTLVSTDLPGNPQIDSSSGLFTWTPPAADGPGFQVTVRVTDSTGLSDTESFTVAVSPATPTNTPPVLASIAAQSATTGQTLTFTASATDADNDTLSYFLDPTAPTGATINATSGVFTWTPTTAGNFAFPVLVTDGTDSAFQNVTVTVNQGPTNTAPSFGPVGNQDVNVNEQLLVNLSASDPENDVLTYSLVSTNLSGVAAVNATTGTFTWTPTETGPGFNVTVQVQDSGGLTDTVTFAVTVNSGGTGGNSAPVIATIPNQTAEAGNQLTFTVTATDADKDTLEFFLDPTAPNGASINSSTGVFTWTPLPADAGPVSFPIFVTDGTTTVQRAVSIVVGDGPGGGGGPNTSPSFGPQNDLTIAANSTLTATFTAEDPDVGDSLTYTLVTQNLPGSPTVNPQTGVFTWTPPTSAAEMQFTVTIRATDLAGASDDAIFNVRVLDEGPGGGGGGGGGGGTNTAPVIADIPDQQATVGQALTFTVMATDADGDTLDYFLDPNGPFTATLSTAGVFTWTPSAADVGTTTFPIFVFDGTTNVFKNVTIAVST